MKKLFTIVAIALVGMMFTSCKKDYTCTCIMTVGSTTAKTSAVYPKTDKSKAKDACNSAQAAYNSAGPGTASCSI